MSRDPTETPSAHFPNGGIWQKLRGRRNPSESSATNAAPAQDIAWALDELRAYRHLDFALFVRPVTDESILRPALPTDVDLHALMNAAFQPLPLVALGRPGEKARDGQLPVDSSQWNDVFHALATYARVILLTPSDRAGAVEEASWLKTAGHLWRGIFWMPDAGTLSDTDWPTVWQRIIPNYAAAGIILPTYTAGGWLFRYAPDGTACTFRMIANPNRDKIAKALEAICQEMKPDQ